MANPVVHHSIVTNAAADPAALVDGPAWDAAHTVTGLENVDNTSDVNKPVSTAQATADALVASNAAAAIALKAALAGANAFTNTTGKNTFSTATLGNVGVAGAGGGVFVGNGSISVDDSAILINRALTPASGLLNSHAVRDESGPTQAVTASGFSGYASFDSAVTINGSATTAMNHLRSFQARPSYNSTGTVNEVAGVWVGMGATLGTVANFYGVHITNSTLSGGATSTNQYAFYSDILSGATNNWFLFQGGVGNPSSIPGNVYIGGLLSQQAAEKANLEYTSAVGQGMIFYDTNAVAGTGSPCQFWRNGSTVGTITNTLTTTAFNTSSDERLKDFIGEYDPAEAARIIRADPVREFTWKSTGERAIGWGAQTSHAIAPDLATPGDADMTKKPGAEGFEQWFVDMSKRAPHLWAALSSALDRIDELEKRLTAAGVA